MSSNQYKEIERLKELNFLLKMLHVIQFFIYIGVFILGIMYNIDFYKMVIIYVILYCISQLIILSYRGNLTKLKRVREDDDLGKEIRKLIHIIKNKEININTNEEVSENTINNSTLIAMIKYRKKHEGEEYGHDFCCVDDDESICEVREGIQRNKELFKEHNIEYNSMILNKVDNEFGIVKKIIETNDGVLVRYIICNHIGVHENDYVNCPISNIENVKYEDYGYVLKNENSCSEDIVDEVVKTKEPRTIFPVKDNEDFDPRMPSNYFIGIEKLLELNPVSVHPLLTEAELRKKTKAELRNICKFERIMIQKINKKTKDELINYILNKGRII